LSLEGDRFFRCNFFAFCKEAGGGATLVFFAVYAVAIPACGEPTSPSWPQ
jgi:hypothetical protein